MKIVENAEPFFQDEDRSYKHSFGYGVLIVLIVTLTVSAGYLGTLLYVNQSQNPIQASQNVSEPIVQSTSASLIPPLAPPAPRSESLP